MYAAYIHDELTNQQDILNNDDVFTRTSSKSSNYFWVGNTPKN